MFIYVERVDVTPSSRDTQSDWIAGGASVKTFENNLIMTLSGLKREIFLEMLDCRSRLIELQNQIN